MKDDQRKGEGLRSLGLCVVDPITKEFVEFARGERVSGIGPTQKGQVIGKESGIMIALFGFVLCALDLDDLQGPVEIFAGLNAVSSVDVEENGIVVEDDVIVRESFDPLFVILFGTIVLLFRFNSPSETRFQARRRE